MPFADFFLQVGAQYIVFCDSLSCNYRVSNKSRLLCGQVMSVEAMVQTMIDDLTAALGDAVKHDKGNAAAGTRVR